MLLLFTNQTHRSIYSTLTATNQKTISRSRRPAVFMWRAFPFLDIVIVMGSVEGARFQRNAAVCPFWFSALVLCKGRTTACPTDTFSIFSPQFICSHACILRSTGLSVVTALFTRDCSAALTNKRSVMYSQVSALSLHHKRLHCCFLDWNEHEAEQPCSDTVSESLDVSAFTSKRFKYEP